VFIAVAPRAPEDALSEGFLQARGWREHIAQTGAEHDLASGVLLACVVGDGESRDIVRTDRRDGSHGIVAPVSRGVPRDLLAGQTTELGRRSSLYTLV